MLVLVRQWTNDHCVSNARSTENQLRVDRNHRSADGNCLLQICAFFCLLLDEYIHHLGKDRNRSNIGNVVSSRGKNKNCQLKDIIYISLKIKPNSFRIRSLSCQIFVLPSTGFEFTPLIHCSNNRLALCPAPQTTRSHSLYTTIASIVEVLPCLIKKIQRQT